METITLTYKNVFGNHRLYATDPKGQLILKLMNAKSFTQDDARLLREQYKVVINGDVPADVIRRTKPL